MKGCRPAYPSKWKKGTKSQEIWKKRDIKKKSGTSRRKTTTTIRKRKIKRYIGLNNKKENSPSTTSEMQISRKLVHIPEHKKLSAKFKNIYIYYLQYLQSNQLTLFTESCLEGACDKPLSAAQAGPLCKFFPLIALGDTWQPSKLPGCLWTNWNGSLSCFS